VVHGSFDRFLYTTQLSTINKIYHEVLLVSILVAMTCLFRASHKSRGVESASILNGVECRQHVIGRAPTVDVSGSDWTDLGSGSHGSSVRNGRSRVISFRDGSDPSEMVGNTVSRVCLF